MVAVTCTEISSPEASVFGPQVSTWLPAAPLIEQSGLSGLSDQVTVPTVPPGSGSLIAAPVAVPGPLLCNVIVNPIWSPAFTGS